MAVVLQRRIKKPRDLTHDSCGRLLVVNSFPFSRQCKPTDNKRNFAIYNHIFTNGMHDNCNKLDMGLITYTYIFFQTKCQITAINWLWDSSHKSMFISPPPPPAPPLNAHNCNELAMRYSTLPHSCTSTPV